ncbi:hypothetical protein ACOBQX_27770 [Actinokineospora sp. G85]|uniref:hypothetical protein n=1 Tax=Actinokineospora sp. G85 TaxID=3406626 RepID=UPI003C71D596
MTAAPTRIASRTQASRRTLLGRTPTSWAVELVASITAATETGHKTSSPMPSAEWSGPRSKPRAKPHCVERQNRPMLRARPRSTTRVVARP